MKLNVLNMIQEQYRECTGCMLHQERHNVVFGYGNPNAKVMVIGEAPGEKEDNTGYPFVGAAGNLLDQYLAQASHREDIQSLIDEINKTRKYDDKISMVKELRDLLLEDFYFTNVVMCRPPENRDPTPKEIEACRTRLQQQIYVIDPLLIVTAGSIATQALVGRKISITQSRGELFDVEIPGHTVALRYPVLAVLQPSFLLRKNDFNQSGGDGEKTYNDFVRMMNIVHDLSLHHYGIPIPINKPQTEGRR